MALQTDVLPVLVAIPAGAFVMGDNGERPDEQPAHRVQVSAFQLARFPVTNREYEPYLLDTQSAEPRFWRDERFNQPNQPVVGVSWFEAIAYCSWLTRVAGEPYRLPTEAEREWAGYGGRVGVRYPWGDEEPELTGYWARGAAGQNRPLAVRDANPNGYGLCHMQDNVHEWCSDWYGRGYYVESPVEDPRGPATGERRSSRGGAWRHDLKFSRIASRSSLPPHLRYNDYGFRVAAEI